MGASTRDDIISSPTWASCLAYLCRRQPRPEIGVSKSSTPTSFLVLNIGRGGLSERITRASHCISDDMRLKGFISLVLFALFLELSAYAEIPQREKRIYPVDVTSSMQGRGSVPTPDILDKVKASLTETLQEIVDTTTEIEIILFTDKVNKGINATISNRDVLVDFVNSLKVQKGDTNIADAWSYGVSRTDTL